MSHPTHPTEPQRRSYETIKAQLTQRYIFARRRGLHVSPTPPFSDPPFFSHPFTSHPFTSHPFYTCRPLLTQRLKSPGPHSWLPKPIHNHFQELIRARNRLFRLITGGMGAENTTQAVAPGFPFLQRDVLVELAARISSHEIRLGCVNWHCLTFEDKRFFWEEVDRAGRVVWEEMVGACVEEKEESVDKAVETFIVNERVVKEKLRKEGERLAERERGLNQREAWAKDRELKILKRECKVLERELLVMKRAEGIEFLSSLPGPRPVGPLRRLGDRLLPPIGHERALRLQAEKDSGGKGVKEASNKVSSSMGKQTSEEVGDMVWKGEL